MIGSIKQVRKILDPAEVTSNAVAVGDIIGIPSFAAKGVIAKVGLLVTAPIIASTLSLLTNFYKH